MKNRNVKNVMQIATSPSFHLKVGFVLRKYSGIIEDSFVYTISRVSLESARNSMSRIPQAKRSCMNSPKSFEICGKTISNIPISGFSERQYIPSEVHSCSMYAFTSAPAPCGVSSAPKDSMLSRWLFGGICTQCTRGPAQVFRIQN